MGKSIHNVPSQAVKIFYANIDNSIMSKYDALIALNAIASYDILALTEMKPKIGLVPDHNIMCLPEYDLFTSNFSSDATRGTGIYVKKDFMAKQVFPKEDAKFEDSTWITIRGQDESSILFGVVYRSGSPAKVIPLDPKLHSLLRWAASINHSQKVIVGDFNHPGITWTPDPQLAEGVSSGSPSQRFVECIRDTFLLQHISEPTRYRDGQRSTLDDLLFTNEHEMVEDLKIRDPVGASDHASISSIMTFASQDPIGKGVYRNYNRADYDEMRKAVNLDWHEIFREKSVQEMLDIIEQVLNETVDRYVPKIDPNNGRKRRKSLWMNQNAIRKVKRNTSFGFGTSIQKIVLTTRIT